jgi:hypothetical protein
MYEKAPPLVYSSPSSSNPEFLWDQPSQASPITASSIAEDIPPTAKFEDGTCTWVGSFPFSMANSSLADRLSPGSFYKERNFPVWASNSDNS